MDFPSSLAATFLTSQRNESLKGPNSLLAELYWMGFFDRFRGQPNDAFKTDEALLYLLFMAMTTDGDIKEEEIKNLKSILRRVDIFESIDDAAIIPLQKRYRLLRGDHDRKVLLNRLTSSIPSTSTAAAYAFVLEILFAKGRISTSEEEFAGKVCRALKLKEKVAGEIQSALRQGLVLDELEGPVMNFAPRNRTRPGK